MARIYSEWLPSSGYEVIDAPTFSFTKMDAGRDGYAYSEVWTPISLGKTPLHHVTLEF
jgi:AraC family transcriptional regulator